MTKRIMMIGFILGLIGGLWGILNRVNAEDNTPTNFAGWQDVNQQATSTPAAVQLPSGTPSAPPATETPTRTPTVSGSVFIEAKNADTNVRRGPDINEDRLGTIQPGTQYRVISRRFQWIQIEYPDTPGRRGWVYQDVINIIGDPNQIPEIDPELLPTIDPTQAAAEETELAATRTPGGFLTLTAAVQITPEGILTLPPTQRSERPTLAPGEKLPTFTFPPATFTPIATDNFQQEPEDNITSVLPGSTFAPIIPIVGLAGLGLMGLLISLLRRV